MDVLVARGREEIESARVAHDLGQNEPEAGRVDLGEFVREGVRRGGGKRRVEREIVFVALAVHAGYFEAHESSAAHGEGKAARKRNRFPVV